MDEPVFLTAGNTTALTYAKKVLQSMGCKILSAPDPSVTHLLLPVPSFAPDGTVNGGGVLKDILTALPKDITVMGGNLDREELSGYKKVDFLKDAMYLAENAAITAYCAIGTALEHLPVILRDCSILIIGWGRIGKCLADLLKSMGAKVSVFARKESDKAMLAALGYRLEDLAKSPAGYKVIFNTAPAMMLPEDNTDKTCLKIDLASLSGIAGKDVIWARGLPNKKAPESSGELIARTAIRLVRGKEL